MTAAEAMSRAPEVRAPRTHPRTYVVACLFAADVQGPEDTLGEGRASNGEVLNQDRLRPGPRLRAYVGNRSGFLSVRRSARTVR